MEVEETPDQEPSTPADLAPPSTLPPPAAPKPLWRRTRFLAAALALFAVLLPAYINRPGSDQNGNYNIYVATIDGQSTRLTQDAVNDLHPAWSPDGGR